MVMASSPSMAKGRKPKPYKKGPRKQMTLAWKQLVLQRLGENDKAGIVPGNLSQLSDEVEADKRGIYETFNLDRDPPQMSSAYVDAICEALKIGPPMLEASHDDELERDLDVVRQLTPAQRRAMLVFVRDFKL